MEEIKNQNKIKPKIKIVDFIYIGVIFIVLIIILILFMNSAKFFIKNINKIFTQADIVDSRSLDIEKYKIIEKKLNLPINNIQENGSPEISVSKTEEVIPAQPESNTNTENVTNGVEGTETITPALLDKESVIITVLNGARKSGVAGAMSAELEKIGFSKITTSDSKSVYPITTIMIKESKKEYTSLIEETVKVLYPKAKTEINKEESKSDIIIIVGKE